MKKLIKCINQLNLLMFVILFALLSFHAPKDLFTPYLWAEDGSVLMQGAMNFGIKTLFIPGNGAYWVIQKLIGLLCYCLLLPFNNIQTLPYLMQIVSKLLATLSILYFISERFNWILPNKWHRFYICVAVALLFPVGAFDVVTCDTALPFYFVFTVFLIGVDVVCNPKTKTLSAFQTIFLVLFALSSAAAPFSFLIGGISFVRFFIFCKKGKKPIDKKVIIIEIIKLLCIFSAVFIQLLCVKSSGRSSSNLELIRRLYHNTKDFIFIPFAGFDYLKIEKNWLLFLIGLLTWFVAWKIAKIPFLVVLYSGIFSFTYMFICSMTGTVDDFYKRIGAVLAPRYIFACFEISSFILILASQKLIYSGRKNLNILGYISITALSILALSTYNITVVGADYASTYRQHAPLFDKKGKQVVSIPIGPWSPWSLKIPANIRANEPVDDVEFVIEATNDNWIGTENFGKFSANEYVKISGWSRTGIANQTFSKLLIKNPVDGIYYAATSLVVRQYFMGSHIEHNGFTFVLPSTFFNDGLSVLEVYGETSDRVWHHISFGFETSMKDKITHEDSKLPDYPYIEEIIPFTVDDETYNNGSLYLRGWAYHENDRCYVYVENTDKFYKASVQSRPDVQQAFSLADDKQGFSIKLNTENKDYTLYLVNETKHEIYTLVQKASEQNDIDSVFDGAKDIN